MNYKFLLSFLILLVTATAGGAQVATIDSKRVFNSMPVFVKIDTLVQSETQKYSQEYMKKKLKAQLLITAVDSLQQLPARSGEAVRVLEAAQSATADLKQFEAGANQKVAEYKEILLKPYLDQVNRAVKITAQRLKYKQVLDVQQVPFVYVDVTSDITEAVIAELKKD